MVVSIPTGRIAFLFSDVEGSTRLWESDPDGMAASLAHHDRIIRSNVDTHRGHVFSTAGDAFAVAFGSTDQAVAAAVAIQLGLMEADWPGPPLRIRMGIHTGTAEERDGDYFGPVLNRAARIMSAGHGGQILVSSVAAGALDAERTSTLHDLGTHHLKDLAAPEQLYELRHPDLPRVDRAIRTVDVRRHNLPDYLTSFVGRAAQLAEVADLLEANRLVALTGVGGTGKTRLAVEAARDLLPDLPDGAWLVELAPVTNPQYIMTTIGEVWGLRPGEGATIEDVIVRHLWSRDLLLVIDNCEHLLDAATAAIKLLLDSCPRLRIVATSRESLGIPGEAMLRVPSLGLADASHSLADSEAARLFLDRARSVRPDFDPSDEEMVDVGRICVRIDGIPLGLELAAARLRSMSARELADRLDRSFRILSGSAKTSLPRQRTLHATIDWSYDLLEPEEQAMFRRLSVFAGGFDVRAAEAVCVGDEVEEWQVLDLLDSLVDKSLIIPGGGVDGRTRYRMLEPVRQFAQEQLSGTAEPVRFRAAHARYFLRFIEEAAPGMRGPDIGQWQRRIQRDYDNVRAALDTLLETGEFDAHLSMACSLNGFWMHTGLQMEGIDLGLEGLRAAGDEADPLTAIKVWWTTSILAAELTRPDGIEFAREGLALARSLGDPNAIGRMELALGATIRHATTDPEYLEHLVEGRRLLEAHPEPHWWDPEWEFGLNQLLLAAYLPDEDDRVDEHFSAALDVFESKGDVALLGATLNDASGHVYLGGDRERALEMSRRAIEIYAELDSPNWYGHILQTSAMLLSLEGAAEMRTAMERASEAAGLLDTVGDVSCWATSNRIVAKCEVGLDETEATPSRLLAILDRMPVLPMQELAIPRTVDRIAELLLHRGRPSEGAVLLGHSQTSEPSESQIRALELEEIRARAREVLGATEADRLMAEGAALDVDEVLEQAREWLEDL